MGCGAASNITDDTKMVRQTVSVLGPPNSNSKSEIKILVCLVCVFERCHK